MFEEWLDRRGFLERTARTLVAGSAVLPIVPGFERRLSQEWTLSPRAWDETTKDRFWALNEQYGQPKPLARGRLLIAGTSNAFAIRIGLETLQQGGSAVDAAIATSLAQIAIGAGSVTSYAGVMNLLHFDARTNTVQALDAGYDVPRAERDPMSIPSPPTPSGRATLVPGFMKGLEAAHERFGVLPFARLVEPAIHLADDGFPIGPTLAGWIEGKRETLTRFPATRAIFSRRDGSVPQVGDRFRQIALARTLEMVASEGPDYMYRGPWARALVDAIQGQGGHLALSDMEAYSPTWSEPLMTTYRGHEVFGIPGGQPGSTQLLEGLNLLEKIDPQQYGHYTDSPEALYWMIQTSRVGNLISNVPAEGLSAMFPERSFAPHDRVRKEHAEAVFQKMGQPGWMRSLQDVMVPRGSHSEGILAVDGSGNIAALGHTINTVLWGSSGLFVDGVSIPDSGAYQQSRMALAGPGNRIWLGINPVIATRDGEPSVASTGIGSGIHSTTLQRLHNIFDFGMDPQSANETAIFLSPIWSADPEGLLPYTQQGVRAGDFPDHLLQAVRDRGQPIMVLDPQQGFRYRGFWIGLTRSDEGGEYQGSACQELNGYALAE